ncbi:MAG: YwqH-like family protein [Bacillota bacterium]
MSFSSTLYGIQRIISSQSNDIDEKIERLIQAKSDISQEQDLLLQEIRKINQPDLGRDWTGKRAHDYDLQREEAYSVMQKIGQIDYAAYQRLIESKINSLEIERSFLNVTRAIAYEAGQLVDKGEDAIDELSEKIGDLKRRLF